jgi:hypothetical protein
MAARTTAKRKTTKKSTGGSSKKRSPSKRSPKGKSSRGKSKGMLTRAAIAVGKAVAGVSNVVQGATKQQKTTDKS